jgi:replicative DNA helicase
MPTPPDDSARAAAGTLPDDPEADTAPMGAPTLAPRLDALLPEAFDRMRRRKSGEERPIPLPWPTMADPLGGGLWPGLHVLVGSTGAGKTQWCLQIALEAAKADTPVLYVALEAGAVEFPARCLGLEANIHWSALYHGRHDGLDALITKHAPTLEGLPIHVRFAPPRGWHYTKLTAAAKALRATYPEATPGARPLLVILDFLQIVGAADTHEDLRERIGNAANVAGAVAREENAAVILASSTARTNYEKVSGDDKEPLGQGSAARLVGLGKESGDIEFAADTVLVLAKDWLAISKVRAGIPAWVELRFNGTRFTAPPNKEPLRGAPTR